MAEQQTKLRLTRRQVREVDRIAIERYGVPGIVLMENAARGLSAAAVAMLRGRTRALIFCGGGNNGGDGMAVARHLHNNGMEVEICLCTEAGKYKGDALINWKIVEAMRLPVWPFERERVMRSGAGLVIDAIFGTGLSEPPRAPFGEIVRAIDDFGAPVLAVDLPSGLDCDSGAPLGEMCIRAEKTVTFVAEKMGFTEKGAKVYTGEVVVAEIGCPKEILDEVVAQQS